MAVSVQQDVIRFCREFQGQFTLFRKLDKKFLKRTGCLSNTFRVGRTDQINVIISDSRSTTRFTPNNWNSCVSITAQRVNIVTRIRNGSVKHPLRDKRSSTTLLLRQQHLKSTRFKQLHRSFTDRGFAVVHKRIGKEDDLLVRCSSGLSLSEPLFIGRTDESRHITPPIDTDEFLGKPFGKPVVDCPAGERGEHRS